MKQSQNRLFLFLIAWSVVIIALLQILFCQCKELIVRQIVQATCQEAIIHIEEKQEQMRQNTVRLQVQSGCILASTEVAPQCKEQLEQGAQEVQSLIDSLIQQIRKQRLYADDTFYPGFYGRLIVPSVGIDVALYSGTDLQHIVDRQDSAAIYSGTPDTSCIVADHNHQGFRPLTSVRVGTRAYILQPSGRRINLKCVNVMNGHNIETGIPYDIVDGAFAPVYGQYNVATYTCLDSSYNIRICGWMVTNEK